MGRWPMIFNLVPAAVRMRCGLRHTPAMGDELMLVGAIVGLTFLAGVLIGLLDRRNFHPVWLAIAGLLLVINDFLLTNGFFQIPAFPGGDWNWQGKILALAATLAIAALPAFGWKNIGLTLRQAPGSVLASLPAIAAYVAFVLILALIFPNEPASAETIAFQLTMPGLEETPFYLGILLFALDSAFRGRWRFAGIDWGWSVIIASMAFGLVHALGYSDGAFHFDALTMALTSAPSVLVYWIRVRTGSLLLPILLHNFGNTLTLFV